MDATLGSVSPVQSLNGAVQSELSPSKRTPILIPSALQTASTPMAIQLIPGLRKAFYRCAIPADE